MQLYVVSRGQVGPQTIFLISIALICRTLVENKAIHRRNRSFVAASERPLLSSRPLGAKESLITEGFLPFCISQRYGAF